MLASLIYRRCKIVLAVRGFTEDDMQLSKLKKAFFRNIIDVFTIRNSDIIYTVCQYGAEKKIIKNHAGNRFFGVIYNSISENDEMLEAYNLRHEYNFDE